MVTDGVQSSAPEVVPGVWERGTVLSTAVVRPFVNPWRMTSLLPALLGGLAILVARFAGYTAIAIAAQGVIAAGAAAIVVGVLRDRRIRAALELFLDHQYLEEAEFRRETGRRKPRRRREVERWLDDHPRGPGRASCLAMLGRFEEAERELEVSGVSSPTLAYLRADLASKRVLYAGGIPDPEPLRAAWHAIDDPSQRHLRWECLAWQEALVEVASGGDGTSVLARARSDAGTVLWRARAEWLCAQAALIVVALAALDWLARLALGF
jgi:hypothetical protein